MKHPTLFRPYIHAIVIFSAHSHSRIPQRTTLLAFSLLTALAICTNAGAELQFHANGVLVYQVFNTRDQQSYILHKDFSIKRRNDEWLIRTSNRNNEEDPGAALKYAEAGCDGSDVYWFTLQDTNRLPIAQFSKPIPETRHIYIATGRATPGPVPMMEFNLIAPVWLAYGGGSYFRSNEKEIVPPITFLDPELFYTNTLKAQWHFLSSAPWCLKDVTYFSDGTATFRTQQGDVQSIRYDSPWDQGFPMVTYELTDTTNVAGHLFPAAFVLTYKVPSANEKQLRTFWKISGRTSLVTFSPSEGSLLPDVVTPAVIVDDRFLANGYRELAYTVTNDWPAKDSAVMKKYLNYYDRNYSKLRAQQGKDTRSQKARVVTCALLLSPIVLVLLFRSALRRGKPI